MSKQLHRCEVSMHLYSQDDKGARTVHRRQPAQLSQPCASMDGNFAQMVNIKITFKFNEMIQSGGGVSVTFIFIVIWFFILFCFDWLIVLNTKY